MTNVCLHGKMYVAISHLLSDEFPAIEQAEKLDSLVVHYAVKLFTFFTAKLRGESAKMGVSKIGSSVCRPFFISSKALKAGEDREKSMKPFQMRSTEREGVKGGENCAYVFFMAAL